MKLPSDDLPRVDGERLQEIGRIHLRGGEEEPTPFDRDLSKPRSSKGRRMRPKPQCP